MDGHLAVTQLSISLSNQCVWSNNFSVALQILTHVNQTLNKHFFSMTLYWFMGGVKWNEINFLSLVGDTDLLFSSFHVESDSKGIELSITAWRFQSYKCSNRYEKFNLMERERERAENIHPVQPVEIFQRLKLLHCPFTHYIYIFGTRVIKSAPASVTYQAAKLLQLCKIGVSHD